MKQQTTDIPTLHANIELLSAALLDALIAADHMLADGLRDRHDWQDAARKLGDRARFALSQAAHKF